MNRLRMSLVLAGLTVLVSGPEVLRAQGVTPQREYEQALRDLATNRDRALQTLERLAKDHLGQRVGSQAKAQAAELLWGKGETNRAQILYEELAHSPASPDSEVDCERSRAQWHLGRMQAGRGQLEAARIAWKKVLTDYKEHGRKMVDGSTAAEFADFEIGTSYLHEGRRAEGIAYLKDFVKRRANCYLAHRAKSLLEQQGVTISAAQFREWAQQRKDEARAVTLARIREEAAGECGPRCLERALQVLGSAARLTCDRKPEDASSFAELREWAAGAGLTAEGKFVAKRDLHQVKLPAVLRVRDRHFILVESLVRRPHGIRYFDPRWQRWTTSQWAARVFDPARPEEQENSEPQTKPALRTVALEEVQEVSRFDWDGYCLELSKGRPILAKPPSPPVGEGRGVRGSISGDSSASTHTSSATTTTNLPFIGLLALFTASCLSWLAPRSANGSLTLIAGFMTVLRCVSLVGLALVWKSQQAFGNERSVTSTPKLQKVRLLSELEMTRIVGGRAATLFDWGEPECSEGSDGGGGGGGGGSGGG